MLIGSRSVLSLRLWFTENREIISVLSCSVLLLIFYFLSALLSLVGNSAAARAVISISTIAVFLCVQTMVWLPVFGIVNMCMDVDACTCTLGLYGHCKRENTESWLGEKSLSRQGHKPASILCLAFHWDTQPTELSQRLYHQVTSTVYLMQMPINIFGEILQVATTCKCFSYAVGCVTLVDLWSVGKGWC